MNPAEHCSAGFFAFGDALGRQKSPSAQNRSHKCHIRHLSPSDLLNHIVMVM